MTCSSKAEQEEEEEAVHGSRISEVTVLQILACPTAASADCKLVMDLLQHAHYV
jgi:hypothetical protein